MTAPAIDLEQELTPEQLLYRAEKARRAERVRPEMVAAAAELERIEQIARENGKGGRPKNAFNVGKGTGRPRRTDPDADAPGRPEWLTPPTPPKEPGPLPAAARRPLTSTPTMPETRPATECGHETPRRAGPAPKFCDDCKPARAMAAPTTRKPKADKPKKKRKAIRTGYQREANRSTRDASTSSMLDQLKSELATVDARREHLVNAIDALVQLEQLA